MSYSKQTEPKNTRVFWQRFTKIPIPPDLNLQILNSKEEKSQVFGTNNNSFKYLEGLQKINFFVGANNSGKSYLLKRILQSFYIQVNLSEIDQIRTDIYHFLASFQISKDILQNFFQTLFSTNSLSLTEKFFWQLAEILICQKDTKIFLQKFSNFYNQNLYKFLFDPKGLKILEKQEIDTWQELKTGMQFSSIQTKIVNLLKNLREKNPLALLTLEQGIKNLQTIYIPSAGSYQNQNFIQIQNKTQDLVQILTKQNITEKIFFLTKFQTKFKHFEEFLTWELFQGQKVKIIFPQTQTEFLFQIGGEYKKLSELSDGSIQMLNLTLPLFLYRQAILLIEEPESNLHPGWQRQLIKLYTNKLQNYGLNTDNFLFLITTHSNYLLDAAIDFNSWQTTIFQVFKKLNQDTRETVDSKKNSTVQFFIKKRSVKDLVLFSSLGVDISSIFLAKGVIFVEGVTDILYIRKWLELWQEEQKEKFSKLGKTFQEVQEGIDYTFQTLGSDRYNFNFKICFHQQKNLGIYQQTFCLAPRHLVVIDNDSDYDCTKKPNQQSKKENGTGRKKRSILKDSIESQNLSFDNLKSYKNQYTGEIDLQINHKGRVRECLAFWMNQGTIETYLQNFWQTYKPKSNPKKITKEPKTDWQKLEIVLWEIDQRLKIENCRYYDKQKIFQTKNQENSFFSKNWNYKGKSYFFIPEGDLEIDGQVLSLKLWLANLIARIDKVKRQTKMQKIKFTDFLYNPDKLLLSQNSNLGESLKTRSANLDFSQTSKILNTENFQETDLRRKIQGLYWTIRYWQANS